MVMADQRVKDFPSAKAFQQLVSSFPIEWQGLFAALNVEESQAMVAANQWWLHDQKVGLKRKSHVTPLLSNLTHSLCQDFPIVVDSSVVFWPKFACLTMKLQRNLLCFITMHSDSLSDHSLEQFLAMLCTLDDSKSWRQILTVVLRNKLDERLTQSKHNMNDMQGAVGEHHISQNGVQLSGIKELKNRPVHAGISSTLSTQAQERLNILCERMNSNTPYLGSKLLAYDIDSETGNHRESPVLDANSVKLTDNFGTQTGTTDLKFDLNGQMETGENLESTVAAVASQSLCKGSHLGVVRTELSSGQCQGSQVQGDYVDVPAPPDTIPEVMVLDVEVTADNETASVHGIERSKDMDVDNFELEESFPEKVLKLKEYFRVADDIEDTQYSEFVQLFREFPPKKLDNICTFLEISKFSEQSLVIVVQEFVQVAQDCSFQNAVVFANQCIGPKLKNLQQAASRNLLNTVSAFAKTCPKAFVESIMVTDLHEIAWPCSDLIIKIFKTTEKGILKHFMGKVLASDDASFFTNDNVLLILIAVLDKKIDFDDNMFQKLVSVLQTYSHVLGSNLKFTKLLVVVVNKYGPLVKQSLVAFQHIFEENKTFLKKSGLTALKKLQDMH